MAVPLPSRPRRQRPVEFAAFLVGGLALVMLVLSLASSGPRRGDFVAGPVSASLLLSMSVALLLATRGDGRKPWPGLALAGAVGGVSLMALVAYLFGRGLAVLPEARHGGLPLLRLSVLTAVSLLALAFGFSLGPGQPRASWARRQVAALLAMIPTSIGALVLVSFPEGVLVLNGGQSTPMSLPSALGCLVLGLALLGAVGNDVWPLALFGSETARPYSASRWLRRGPLRLFLVLTLGILALGSLYLRGQVMGARQAAQKDLALTADSKVREIRSWFAERQGDAEQIRQSSLLQDGILAALRDPDPAGKRVREWMASFGHAYGYRHVAVYDAGGALRLVMPEDGRGIADPAPGAFQAALSAGKVTLADLHRGPGSAGVEMSFWVPLGRAIVPGQPAEGLLRLQLDAEQFLYPLLASSSILGSSVETLLVRREGGDAVYLSELRGRPGSALNLRASLAVDVDAPATRAALGQQGSFAGPDHRGRRVIAAVRQIPGTPWSMVTKADEAEIFGPLRRWVRLSGSALLGLVVLVAMAMGLIVRQGDARRILSQLAFERERKALAERFTMVFSTSPDAMTINRLEDGVYLDINQGFTRITGFTPEEVVGRSSLDPALDIWVRPADREALLARLRTDGEVVDLEAPFRMKDGRIITGLMTAKLLVFDQEPCLITATRDLTQRKLAEEERRELENRLHLAQRQESVGALAGGVAHDMNNVLGAILSLASSHRSQLQAGDPMAASFDTIVSACLRGRGVVKSLLCFARKELEETHPVDLNQLVEEVVELLAHTTLQRLGLERRLEPGLWRVQGDGGTLSHAIMNLCVNAMDAMPGGGKLLLHTENLAEGRVRLTVTDTGEGMSPEVMERAMEPFFTTKPMGKGTGLGLAMVFGTVKAHGGTVELRSRPGEGTSVLLTFPAAAAAPPPSPAGRPSPGKRSGALDILLVDDDELIRASVTPMLELFGHRVRAAAGGEEALALMDNGLQVDLVILDLNMPGMNGAQTLRAMLERKPEQPVLLASGYSEDDFESLRAGRPRVDFLQKPFTLAELGGKLKDLCLP